jgi:hypothetical protein
VTKERVPVQSLPGFMDNINLRISIKIEQKGVKISSNFHNLELQWDQLPSIKIHLKMDQDLTKIDLPFKN